MRLQSKVFIVLSIAVLIFASVPLLGPVDIAALSVMTDFMISNGNGFAFPDMSVVASAPSYVINPTAVEVPARTIVKDMVGRIDLSSYTTTLTPTTFSYPALAAADYGVENGVANRLSKLYPDYADAVLKQYKGEAKPTPKPRPTATPQPSITPIPDQ